MSSIRRFARRWRLVMRFAGVSLLAFLVIGGLLSMLISRQIVDQQDRAARDRAEFVANSILRYELTPQDLSFLVPMRGTRYEHFQAFVKNRILRYPIVLVKIWRSDGTVIFASAPSLVGKRFTPLSDDLYEAFHTGHSVNSLTGPAEENEGVSGLPPKILETHVPVFVDPLRKDGPPMAVVETYTDYAVVQTVVSRSERTIVTILVVGLFVLFVMLLPIARRVSKRVEDQAHKLATLLESERRGQAERRRLLDRTVQAAEAERILLAAELHDGPVQRLVRLGYGMERVKNRQDRGDTAGARELLQAMQTEMFAEVGELRGMMSRLRPPILDQRGLEEALRDSAASIERGSGVKCTVKAEPVGRLEERLETVVYRVSQEALANVVKHAGARSAHLSLSRSNGSVILEVRDDGIGFEPGTVESGTDHFGLMGMRERVEMVGGEWNVESAPGAGTRVRAVLPAQEARR